MLTAAAVFGERWTRREGIQTAGARVESGKVHKAVAAAWEQTRKRKLNSSLLQRLSRPSTNNTGKGKCYSEDPHLFL